MSKISFFIVLILITCSIAIHPQNFSGGYNFNLPADDTTSAVFLPYFPADPITNQDFISVNENGNFSVASNRIRFWGTNLVADGAFPDKLKSWYIAGRLRNMGFNLIRFHHMDNPWSVGSLFVQGSDTRHLNLSNLDKLEYLLNELKKNGIYADINLNVGRTFNSLDGVENADSLVDYAKGVTLFDPQLIFLQKEYATQLLTHLNPYTGLALKDDPVMGILEVTNENSLYRMWRDNKLKSFSQNGSLILRHVKMLDSLWINFLSDKYFITANLQAAWNDGTTPPNSINFVLNGDFETPPITQRWQIELHNGAAATISLDNQNPFNGVYSGKVNVTTATGTDWHIQFKQVGITVYKDSIYTVKFSTKSDANRNLTVVMMRDNSPYNVYASQQYSLTTGWNTFEFSFVRRENNIDQTRIAFQFTQTGNYWFDNVSLSTAAIIGLEPGETLEDRSVKRTDYFDSYTYSDQRVKDISEFYITLQNRFYSGMLSFLKDTLGVVCPIVGANWNVGPGDLITHSQSDYIDNHSYWDHPNFPGVPWSSTDWNISNTPMVNSQSGGTIPELFSGVASLNKPFTISEYNHPFPNRYQTEAMLFITGYSAFHNADALMFYDYNGSTDWTTDFISDYFAIHRNNAMMGLAPSCAFAFRNGFISKANETIKINFNPQDVYLLPKQDLGGWSGISLYSKKLALKYAIRNESFNAATTTDFSQLPSDPVNPYKTDTDEINYNTNGLLTLNTPNFVGATGLLNNFGGTQIGNIKINSASDFGTITWVSLNNDSLAIANKSLITISTKLQNTGMIWEGTTTIHDDWGHLPTQMHPVAVELQLNIFADSIKVYPLNPSGNAIVGFEQTLQPSSPNNFILTLDQTISHTIWFGLEKFGDGSTSVEDNEDLNLIDFKIEQNFPNPFNGQTVFRYSVGNRANIEISVYDILGKKVKTLIKSEQQKGNYSISWDGKNENGSDAVSGIYFTRFYSPEFSSTIKTILVK
jgi:hypothetical protein